MGLMCVSSMRKEQQRCCNCFSFESKKSKILLVFNSLGCLHCIDDLKHDLTIITVSTCTIQGGHLFEAGCLLNFRHSCLTFSVSLFPSTKQRRTNTALTSHQVSVLGRGGGRMELGNCKLIGY